MQPGFVVVLCQRIAEKLMSAKQVTDAINNVIDTYRFPVPLVADIVSWDKRIKIYTHQEICEMIPKGYTFDNFEKITVNGLVRWIMK